MSTEERRPTNPDASNPASSRPASSNHPSSGDPPAKEPGASKKKPWPFIVGAVAILAVILVVFLVKRSKGDVKASEERPRDVPRLDGKWIRFSPGYASNVKLAFAPVESADILPVVSVTGTVAFDPEKVAAIGARISGRVRRVVKFNGDPVKPGDLLAEIESAELGQAQTSVLSAKAHSEAAAANEKRETQLAEAKVVSQRDAELAHATASAARAELFAAEQRVRALGGNIGTEVGILHLTSPIEGKIVELNVSRGQSVEPSLTAFRVADLSRVWIELAVFERELGHIDPGDTVDISPQTNTTVTLEGKIAHVGDVIDLDTRSAPVRIVVENKERQLRPGQSVLARIHTTREKGSTALLVPRDAVTTVDGKNTVFVFHDDTSVEPRAVVVGGKDGTRIEVVSGLALGERVVSSGVFALKSEVFR